MSTRLAINGRNVGQPHPKRQPVEIEVAALVAAIGLVIHPEYDTLPALRVECLVEKAALLNSFPIDGNREGVMARGCLYPPSRLALALVDIERDSSSMRSGGFLVWFDRGRLPAEEVVRFEREPAAGAGGRLVIESPPANRAAETGQGKKPHAGGVFRFGDGRFPITFTEVDILPSLKEGDSYGADSSNTPE